VDAAECAAVLFDLDGTLYDQRPMRRRMALALLAAVARGAERPSTLDVLRRFRTHRERLAESEAEEVTVRQYADVATPLGIEPGDVRRVVERWMHQAPLAWLPRWVDPGAAQLLADLRDRGVATAIVSDFPATAKLDALGLQADVVVSAEDAGVDRLKPHPAGLLEALARLGVAPGRALMVGDRPERDGAAAARAGTGFVHRVWCGKGGPDRVRGLDALVGRVGTRRPGDRSAT